MSVAKLRVDIVEEPEFKGPRGGKRYLINKWVFDSRTGLTIDHVFSYRSGLTLKEAREVKRNIKEAYYG